MKICYQQHPASAEKINFVYQLQQFGIGTVLQVSSLQQVEVLKMWPVVMAGINWEGGMAEKITHPIPVGLLHSEGGNSGRSFQSCVTFCSPASQATSAVDVSGCACKCDTVWVTVTAAPSRGTLHLHSPENSVSETPEHQWLLQRYNEII